MEHKKFQYATLDAVKKEAERVGADLPLSEDLSILSTPVTIAGRTLPNRFVVQPMEGSDGTPDGSPGELTRRRYIRFAQGGASLIWYEAVATAPEVRASANQLYMTGQNWEDFARLNDEIRETSMKRNGFAPMIIMQATNSGRYSKPEGVPAPLIAYNNPALEDTPIDTSRILTDSQLQAYEALFGPTAALAQRAGFDGMDVKCCHRYLANELLSAYTREGLYGGSFENRTRFLMNAYAAARAAVSSDFILGSRLNVYDGFEYPWGFGVAEGGGLAPDLSEAKKLVGMLVDTYQIPVLNVTIGNPYRNPHVNRPYDQGNYVPDEHPFTGEARMMHCVGEIQRAYPQLPVIGSAFSYLRQFSPQLAAGMVHSGGAQMVGFGRMAFANPDFPNQIMDDGGVDPKKVCVTCGQCAALLRAGGPSGCVVRDRDVYK